MGVSIKHVFVTGLTETKKTDLEGVGTIRWDEVGNAYRWVKVTATTALTAKQPVCYEVALASTQAILESVLTPATADLMMNAGIAMTAIGASGGLMYGWVQVLGRAPDVLIITPATGAADIEVGSELIAANGTTSLTYQGDAGTAPIYSSHYIALEAVATATGAAVVAKDVYVNCL